MKKILAFWLLLITCITASGCYKGNVLLILNWGEYINDDVVAMFEEEYGCEVIISIADSNELFYSKVMSGTTAYDLVVPSDYMIQKMIEKNLLQEIDFTRLENYDCQGPKYDALMDGIKGIIEYMEDEVIEGYKKHQVPYFWGTFGLMYNKRVAGLEEVVTTKGWEALFDRSLLPAGTKTGMYDVSRYSYAAAMFSLGLSPNTYSEDQARKASEQLIKANFDEWGTDMLKKGISANNLDLAFLYTGDFLDTLYIKLEDGVAMDEMTFDIFVPDDTIAFMDGFVIPKKARHLDLTYKFLDFMMRPEVAYENASVVGYATPLQEAYDMITSYVDDEENEDNDWLVSWRDANLMYYPLPDPLATKKFKGEPLANFDQGILDKINTLVNNAKVGR